MEEAPENGKELSHSAHANGMIQKIYVCSESPEDPPTRLAAVKVILQHYFKEKQRTLLEDCDKLFQ